MSSSLASDQNDPHQSPIWIKAKPIIAVQPMVPRHPTQSSVPNRVQNTITESMVQPRLSRPSTAHGLGETSSTMVDRNVQSE